MSALIIVPMFAAAGYSLVYLLAGGGVGGATPTGWSSSHLPPGDKRMQYLLLSSTICELNRI